MSAMERHSDQLKHISSFPSLVKYLRDELNWPIDSEDFENLTFEYSPEELGIDVKTAAKIREIKQLRPLASGQPWGIFFVSFEPKRLPVVVLRRILQALVVKKRASAQRSQLAVWKLHDLLFISSYGEEDHRDLTFAHFQEDNEDAQLPTLKVLGWDNEDTVSHLDQAHKSLKENLSWPSDSNSLKAWRENWSKAFTLEHRQVIKTSKALAIRMAELATAIRKRVNRILAVETDKGPVRKLMAAFRETLIHDLKEDDFADMYAQTITYGLLAAAISRPAGIVAENIRDMVPNTNPFLRDLLGTFLTIGGRKGKIDFDELGINDVVESLREADMDAVKRDFGDKNPQEDPVIHFYELFLKQYDAKKRMQRGVFYTPRPVVSFIVRSVDEILRDEFGLPDGLADTTTWREMAEKHKGLGIPAGAKPDDPFIQILDPACGTGTFLVEVIDVIHQTMMRKWERGGKLPIELENLWQEYVADHLLPRVYGYELLMAPYAIAHMKIGLKLFETGYRFGPEQRARVYLTNTLEPAADFSGQLELDNPALAHEAAAVNAVKRNSRYTVLIGNPPYSYQSMNSGQHILTQIKPYYSISGEPLGEANPRGLQDDYIKFFRFSELRMLDSGEGILGFITNSSYLDAPTYRGMRASLLKTFSKLYVTNLNGNSRIKIQGERDDNVFDIAQGVAVLLGIARARSVTTPVMYRSIRGARDLKYELLSGLDSHGDELYTLMSPSKSFSFSASQGSSADHYERWSSIAEIMPLHSVGVYTARDEFAVGIESTQLIDRMKEFMRLNPERARQRFNLGPDSRDWQIELAQVDLRTTRCADERVVRFAYRPFDERYIYYTGKSRGICCMPRNNVMQHLLSGTNLALCFVRHSRQGTVSNFFVTRYVTDKTILSPADNAYVAPLFLEPQVGLLSANGRVPNFSAKFLKSMSRFLESSEPSSSQPQIERNSKLLFAYVYSILYSAVYRGRYSEYLMADFPRIPVPGNRQLFSQLSTMGLGLIDTHLLHNLAPDTYIAAPTSDAEPFVESVSWANDSVYLTTSSTRTSKAFRFMNVPLEIWLFRIGTYKVCEKWLKDRKGCTLTRDDVIHFRKICAAISETIRIMTEIDKSIDSCGGWPGAFVVDGNTAVSRNE